MTGGIKEGNRLVVGRYHLVRADRLGNTARLGGGNVGISDSVQNRSLTVVNVTHNADNGGTGNRVLVVFVLFFNNLLLNRDNDFFFHFCSEFGRYNFRGIVVNHFVDRYHHTEFHQFFDNFGSGDTQHGRQFADGDFLRHGNLNLLLLSLLRNTCKTLRLRLSLLGNGSLLSVLLGFLVKFLLFLIIVYVVCRRNFLVSLVVLLQINGIDSGVNTALLALGSRLRGLLGSLLRLFFRTLCRLLRHLQNRSLTLVLLALGIRLRLRLFLRRCLLLLLRFLGSKIRVKTLYAVILCDFIK